MVDAVNGIKDGSGNNIRAEDAFRVLLAVMDELDGYSPKTLEELASKGVSYVGTLARMPLMYSYERKQASTHYRNLNVLTLENITDKTDFLRYALLIEAYRELFHYGNN
jgi:hypothetical protein